MRSSPHGFPEGICTRRRDPHSREGHTTANPLRTLEHLGLLEVDWWGDGAGASYAKAVAAGIDEKDRWPWVGRQTALADTEAKDYPSSGPRCSRKLR